LAVAGLHSSNTNPVVRNDLRELLARAREGGEKGISELLQHYRGYMLLLAAARFPKRLQPRFSPSDLVQETMLKAHRHFSRFQGQSEGELLAWLRQVLVSKLATFVEQHVAVAKRDIRREVSLAQLDGELGEPIQLEPVLSMSGESPSARVQQSEEAALLAERLAELPARYREVLVLRNMQGLSFEEVAARMNRSPGTTRMVWLRAIERLREVYRRAEKHGE
jgi:RNA polymerase sigma-70 factor (ECF subfamily)